MNEFEDVIFEDDDDDIVIESPQQQEPTEGSNSDLTLEMLKLQGISDPTKIKFEEDDGTIIERSWDSLSKEEQLSILQNQIPEDVDLSDEEVYLINTIRQSGMNVQDYIQSLMPKQELYKIDQLSDEDVFALDLLEKVGEDNITDEELQEAIDQAKKNESLFKKTVEGLRKEYVKLQKDEEARQYNDLLAKQEQQYNQFANSILNEIRNFNTFAGQDLELSNSDAEELADFMLTLDENGATAFGKALSDPKSFTEAAFLLLHKDDIINELNSSILNSYKRGYDAAKLEHKMKPINSVKDIINFDEMD